MALATYADLTTSTNHEDYSRPLLWPENGYADPVTV
jgi:hypothetical protein